MMKDIAARTASACRRRMTTKRVTSPSSSRATRGSLPLPRGERGGVRGLGAVPLFDPERRWPFMSGRRHAFEPFRQHESVGAEIKRQRRQFLGIERLKSAPEIEALRTV